jgi:hypothetical protein
LNVHNDTGFVEFFGFPGGGKSTIMDDLAQLNNSGEDRSTWVFSEKQVPGGAQVVFESLLLTLKAIRHDPLGVLRFLAWHGAWWLPLKLGFRLAGLKSRGTSKGQVVVDGGLLQPIVSFAVEHNRPGRAIPVRALLSSLPPPREAIYVKVAPDTAWQRYVMRQQAGGGGVSHPDLQQRFVLAEPVCENLYHECRRTGVPLITLDAEERIDMEHLGQLII